MSDMELRPVFDYSVGEIDDSTWNKLNTIISQNDIEFEESSVSDKTNKSIRISRNSWITSSELRDIFFDLIQYINFNQAGWNFNINNVEPIQHTIYGKGCYYDWHKDTYPISDLNTRKISATIFLNDPDEYEGGELDIEVRGPLLQDNTPSSLDTSNKCRYDTFKMPKKSAVVFRSDLWHRVRPVTSGVRKSLVIWFIGPPFI